MTNDYQVAPSVQLANGAMITDVVSRDPIPWGSLLLLAAWLVAIIVFISAAVTAIKRRRRNRDTDCVARRCLVTGVTILFGGAGIILWSAGRNISFMVAVGSHPAMMIQAIGILLAQHLEFLSINSILAGVGFVMGIMLRGRKGKGPNQALHATSESAPGAGSSACEG